ncbi:MAG: metallophosphoesterase [Bacteroidia bacterium]
MRQFAISDIHGCSNTFKSLIHDKLKIENGDFLYLIGDLIDRGPDTKGVFDEVFSLREEGIQVITLRGNHEQILLDSLESPEVHDFWMRCGGAEVLESFGVNHANEILQEYIDEVRSTQTILFKENYILVHAGLDFSQLDPLANEEAFLRIRKMEVNYEWLDGRTILHGHTPKALTSILEQKGQVINLDGGCVFPERPGHGYLVAMNLITKEFTYSSYKG